MRFIRRHNQPELTGLAILAAVAMATGCAEKKASDKQSDPAAGDGTSQVEQAADQLAQTGQAAADAVAADRTPLTAEEYEKLLLDMASCEVKGSHIDPQCPAKKAFKEARARRDALKDLAGMTSALGKKHIKHPSPAVRVQAAGFLSSIFGVDPSGQAIIIEAARTEKEPAVLIAMIQAIGSKGGKRPEIGKLLVEMGDHENPEVRKKAMVWLGSTWNEEVPGSIEKLIEKIEKDPDPAVRQFACRYSGARGDDRMIPTYKKFTQDPEADPKLYSACMEGLMNSWMHYPLFRTHSEKAYKLTLQRLAHKERSKTTPPWGLLDNFAELAKDDVNPRIAEWRKQAPWYKPQAVMEVLEPIVVDPKAFRLARSAALKSLVALGATKQQLTRMRKRYGEPANLDDKSVVQQLDRAIAGDQPAANQPGAKAPANKPAAE